MPYVISDVFAGPADLYVDNQNVGWVRGGVRIRTNKSMWFRPSLDGFGDEEAVKQTEEFYISTVMVESTLRNLKRAWGVYEGIVSDRIDFGGSVSVPTHSLKFIARDRTLEVGFYKVAAVDFGEISYNRRVDAFIPVTFRALLDTTRSVGSQIGYIEQGNTLGERDLVVRVTVPMIKRKQIVCRLTVSYASGTSNVVSRVSIYDSSTKSLVSRVTIRAKTGKSLVSRVTVTS